MNVFVPWYDDLSASHREDPSLSGILAVSSTTGSGKPSHPARTGIIPFRKRTPPIPRADKMGGKLWAAATRVGLKDCLCDVGAGKGSSVT